MAEQARLRLESFHDVLCAWCYAVSPRVGRLAERHPNVVVEHRCFALAPTRESIVAIFGVQGGREA